MDATPPDVDQLVERFQEITSMQNSEFARTFLQQHSFELDSAIAVGLSLPILPNDHLPDCTNKPPQAYMAGDLEPPAPSRGAATPAEARPTVAGQASPRSWPARILGRALRLLFGPSRPLSFGATAAQAFVDSFEREYGAVRPSFVMGSYEQAVQLATAQSKFLLVYVHSQLHQDTPRFCR